jgi:hypothetical protein
MLYSNGRVPLSVVSVVLGSGRDSKGRYWEHRLTPATAARWAFAVDYAFRKWGKRMSIRSGGPNAYRPLEFQWFYYQDGVDEGNPLQAAYPATSSHGGNWRGRDCLAIDVDPGYDAFGRQLLTWAQVWEACRAAGFECGLITKAIAGIEEPWHVNDFNAFGAVPAFDGFTPFEEDDMSQKDIDEMKATLADISTALGAGNARAFKGQEAIDRSVIANLTTTANKVDEVREYLFAGGDAVDHTLGARNSIYGIVLWQSAQIAGLQAALASLAAGNVDPAVIEHAAQEGAEKAIQGLTLRAS